MSPNWRDWINLWTGLSVLLLSLYAGVFCLARYPDVSAAYQAYYIDRSSDIPPAWQQDQRAALPVLAVGQTYRHDAPEVLLIGWSTAGPDHTWSLGHRSEMLLSLPAPEYPQAPLHLVLNGTYLHGAQRIIATVGNVRIDQTFQDGDAIILPLDLKIAQTGTTIVTLELPDAALPGNGDGRVLAFALQAVSLLRDVP